MRLAHSRMSIRATRTQTGYEFCPESDAVLNALRAACARAGVPFREAVSAVDALAPDTQRKLRERARDDGAVIMGRDEVFALWGCPLPERAPGAPIHRKGRPLARSVVPSAAPAAAVAVPAEPAEEISSSPAAGPDPDLAPVEEISLSAAGARIRDWGVRGRAAPCAVGAGVLVDPERLATRQSGPTSAPKPAGRRAKKAPPRIEELAAMRR